MLRSDRGDAAGPFVFRVLVIAGVALATAGGCGGDPSSGPDGRSWDLDGGPVEADLSGADAEVQDTLRRMIDAARNDEGGARGRLAMTYEANGFGEAALASYRQAGRLDPANPRWPYFAGQLAARGGDLATAQADFEQVAGLDPSYLPLHLRRGYLALDLGQPDRAAEAFQTVLARQPGDVSAHLGMARVQLAESRPDLAVATLEPLAERVTHPYIQLLLGRAYQQAGDEAAAREALARRGGSAEPPGWRDPWNEEKAGFRTGFSSQLIAAERKVAAGDIEGALQVLEALRAERPNDVTTLNNLAVTYLRTRRNEDARAVLEDGVARHPDYFPYRLNLAALYNRDRDFERALGHLDTAIELNPTLSQAHLQRADILSKLRRNEEASRAFEQAMLFNASDPATFVRAAMHEHNMANYPEVSRLSRAALGLNGRIASAWQLLASAEAAQGRFEQAEAAYTRAGASGASADSQQATRERIDQLRRGG